MLKGTLPVSVSRLSRQCGTLNISQSYRPLLPVKVIALLFTLITLDHLCESVGYHSVIFDIAHFPSLLAPCDASIVLGLRFLLVVGWK
jgi:hypothetical protein